MNKLLYKLSRIICFITKSSSQLNPPALFNFFLSTNLLAIYAVFIAFVLSPSFSSRRPSIAAVVVEFAFGRLVLQSNRLYRIPSASSSYKVIWSTCHCCFVAVIWSVLSLRRSEALSVCRLSPSAMAVDFALGRLVHHKILMLFCSLVVVTLFRRFGCI